MGKTLKRVKILNETVFDKQLKELETVDFEVKSLRGFPSIEQTKRNRVGRDLMEGLYNYLFGLLDESGIANVHYTNEGIAIEVENDKVYEQYPEGNGYITLVVNMTIPNLGYDALENLREEDKDYEPET